MKFTHDEAKNKIRFQVNGKDVVVISDTYYRQCSTCGGVQPLELRQTSTGIIYDQPRCGTCRKKKFPKRS
jgi:hypothetical protein